jgi:hypothetical protein
MLEWIESSSNQSQRLNDCLERFPAYSRAERTDRILKSLKRAFPQNKFQILDLDADPFVSSRVRKSVLVAHLETRSGLPVEVDGRTWDEWIRGLRTTANRFGVELNYWREDREQLGFVMRNYALAPRSGLVKTIYHFNLKIYSHGDLNPELKAESKQGLRLEIEVVLPPSAPIFLEKAAALLQAWLTD